jgi:hypothetical protein
MKSAGYFDRFVNDYGFCINREFDQIYATSYEFSYTNGQQFKRFCEISKIPVEEVSPDKYFKKGMCDSAFKTIEYTYDARILREYFEKKLAETENIEVVKKAYIYHVDKDDSEFSLSIANYEKEVHTSFVLNTTYASVNQVNKLFGFELFKMKYELCEIILCDVNDRLSHTGLTVMDGPFFSIMPFGHTGIHSLTSVSFTPHETSFGSLPEFKCQAKNTFCSSEMLKNCNCCECKPKTSYDYMNALAKKYLLDDFEISYRGSMFSVKPIMVEAELDDSRPTIIRKLCDSPTFFSILSGKINTIYDLDWILL